jgi:hypothetical protein
MNYRDLLKKYIEHVSEQEGTSFLGASLEHSSIKFTQGEIQVLRQIDEETFENKIEEDSSS